MGFIRGSFLVIVGSVFGSAHGQGFASHVIHAPTKISTVDFQRLLEFGIESFPKLTENAPTMESPTGDLVIKVKNLGWMVVSKDSELMAPIRLFREIFSLSRKYTPTQLIPFTELSPSALKQFQREIGGQHPRYDISKDSCFTISTQYGFNIRSLQVNFGSSSSPSLFGMDRDKQREFNNSIEKSGLVLVRTEVEAAEFVKKRTYDHDGVFYEPSELPSIKVELDRKGLAEFQAWADFTLHQIDDQIYSRYAFDPQWTTWLKTRTVKTMDDYRQIARGEYDELARGMKLNYKIHRLKSPDDVDAVLEQASIGFHFSFSVSCGLQGTNLRYHFQNRW